MSTEKEEVTIEQPQQEESPKVEEPAPTITKETPKENPPINEQLLETLKALTETNVHLKAELDAQKEEVSKLREEFEADKPLSITVDEFLGVYDYGAQKQARLEHDAKTEEEYAKMKYDELLDGFRSI